MSASAKGRVRRLSSASARDGAYTRKDAEAFIARLREVFPRVILVRDNYADRDQLEKLKILSEFSEIPPDSDDVCFCIVDIGWVPEVVYLGGGTYVLADLPGPIGTVRWAEPTMGILTPDRTGPLTVPQGRIHVSYDKASQKKQRDAIMRAAGYICEGKGTAVNWPSYVAWPPGGYPFWMGKDAARWCRGGPNRILGFTQLGSGHGFVPKELAHFN